MAVPLPPLNPRLIGDFAGTPVTQRRERDSVACDAHEFVVRPATDREVAVAEALDDPLHAVVRTVVLVPRRPAVRLEPVLLSGDRAQGLQRGLLDESISVREQTDESWDRLHVAERADGPRGVELVGAVSAVEFAPDNERGFLKTVVAAVRLKDSHRDHSNIGACVEGEVRQGFHGTRVAKLLKQERGVEANVRIGVLKLLEHVRNERAA